MAKRRPLNPNVNEYGELHFKYREQMQFLKELAEEFGVVMFVPEYHAKPRDCNTVLFYFKEDDDYNRKIDTEAPGLSLEMKNQMYRKQFFSFENTDCNGWFSYDFANYGRIDLRTLGWKEILRGAFEVSYYKAVQNRYIASVGGVLSLDEADEKYNDLNRKIISAFKKWHPRACKGSVNFYDESRQNLIKGKISAVTEYDGGMVFNFGCDFIVPKYDEKLNDLIREWNTPFSTAKVDDIYKRVNSLGGVYFLWK